MKKSAFLALPLFLAGCFEDAAYSHLVGFSAHDSVRSFMISAASEGPLLVGVFGDNARTLGPAIRQGMETGLHSYKLKTTRDVAEAYDPTYRVIWLTNPPQSYNPNRVCKGQIPKSVTTDKPTFAAVFCVGDRVMRDVSGWVNSSVSLPSETFRKFVGVVTRDLFK